ncbi:hypothetical protein V6N13_088351 [Hibiscus sabdariffa]|uniref:DUF4283 domain-containing protein n=1 Tax=Hibiscus sabdariffa TaxID=183260 RepID=A0ABR2FZ33_9ROSI
MRREQGERVGIEQGEREDNYCVDAFIPSKRSASVPVSIQKWSAKSHKEGTWLKVVLDRLCSSIIGTTVKTISVDNLSGLMISKGLDDFEVRQIAGNQFLLDFDCEELVTQCLQWEWD